MNAWQQLRMEPSTFVGAMTVGTKPNLQLGWTGDGSQLPLILPCVSMG